MTAGNEKWRLPLINELTTLIAAGKTPRINTRVFPGPDAISDFWSASADTEKPNKAWVVGFVEGDAYRGLRSGYDRVRLVRNARFDPSWTALDAEERWYDCGEGLAFDRTTGLQWQRYCVGQRWGRAKPSGKADRMMWDEAMSRFEVCDHESKWRIPLIEELCTLVVPWDDRPTIDVRVFPGCPAANFWSGTANDVDPMSAWSVSFENGYADLDGNGSDGFIRLVRGLERFDPSWSALDVAARWCDCGEGLAFDRSTGLQWQRYCVGQQWADGMPTGEAEGMRWGEAMTRFGGARS